MLTVLIQCAEKKITTLYSFAQNGHIPHCRQGSIVRCCRAEHLHEGTTNKAEYLLQQPPALATSKKQTSMTHITLTVSASHLATCQVNDKASQGIRLEGLRLVAGWISPGMSTWSVVVAVAAPAGTPAPGVSPAPFVCVREMDCEHTRGKNYQPFTPARLQDPLIIPHIY
ncbi:hypothetical protein E2C01_008441 [Portunus trituberculatus]|uniref:Uncharacterized protein n=1 Tax=Portunus trituberculatus TaxID=210409 RepID=A0A5B7D0S9_PORTR|nr:hypothetical protein [Portunus trituberculatus]